MRVIELHSPVKLIQRGQGQSATAAAAYRSATRIHCERTGDTHDYRRKKGVEHATILVTPDAPEWALEREKLWNAAELREKHPRAQTARDLEVSFPAEFNPEQRREAGLAIGQMLAERYGAAVDLCWHKPGRNSDERNHHLHVLFTTRRFTEGQWAKTKDRTLDDLFGKGKAEILHMRQGVAGVLNDIAARDRLDVYVEHLSYEKRGLDLEATQHMGPVAAEMERSGQATDIGAKNRAIQARNTERKTLRTQHQAVTQAIAAAEQQTQTPQPVLTPADLTAFYQDTQARQRTLLAELEARHGQQEKEARQALEQMCSAPHENIVGQWRILQGKTPEEQALIAQHQATLTAIEQQRQEAKATFERERLARLEKLKNPEQQAEPTKDKHAELVQRMTAIYRSADNAQALQAALAEAGYTLAEGRQGKRIVVIDSAGETYSLARLVEGAKVKDIRARLAGLVLPDADETLQRLKEAQAPQAQAQEAKPMETKQGAHNEAGRTPEPDSLGQEFAQAAAPRRQPPTPLNYAHFAERQQLENERVRAEGEEAQRRLHALLEQRYGPAEQRLRDELEPLEKQLQGASALKIRLLKLRGKLPEDAEDRLAQLREEQALIEARRQAAAAMLEKTQRENEAAIKRRQEQEREAARGRAPQMAAEFKTTTQLQEQKPEVAPNLPRVNRATSSAVKTRLQKQQWDERFQFSDDATTERHRLERSLELQYKMTDRDRTIAAAYGHARNEAQFEAHKKAALAQLERELKAREQALMARHEQERQNLSKGIAPPLTGLAQKFERHAPPQMEIQPERAPQTKAGQVPQAAAPLPPIVQHPSPELRPPGMRSPAQPLTPDARTGQPAAAEPPQVQRQQPSAQDRQTKRPADDRRSQAAQAFEQAAQQTTEEDAERYALLDQWNAAQRQQTEREQAEQEATSDGAASAYSPENAERYALLDQWNAAQERGLDRGPVLER